MCAKPPTMIACNSDCVSVARYGRIISGASVWPTKTLESHSDSAPEVRIVFIISQAIPCTTRCRMP